MDTMADEHDVQWTQCLMDPMELNGSNEHNESIGQKHQTDVHSPN